MMKTRKKNLQKSLYKNIFNQINPGDKWKELENEEYFKQSKKYLGR